MSCFPFDILYKNFLFGKDQLIRVFHLTDGSLIIEKTFMNSKTFFLIISM